MTYECEVCHDGRYFYATVTNSESKENENTL